VDNEIFDSIEVAEEAIRNGGKVLVHCKMGVSRSPAFCVVLLMKEKKIRYDEALSIIQGKRPSVNINEGFEKQLRSFEEEFFK
jgi:protein-tyrosine phosphatase